MKKPNAYLAKLEARNKAHENHLIDFTVQLCGDIAMIAANEALGMGPGRCDKFAEAYSRLWNEVAAVMLTEANSSRRGDIVYTQEKIDARLREICGDKFVPWEERYQ